MKQNADLLLTHNNMKRNQSMKISSAESENNKIIIYFLCEDRSSFSFKYNLTVYYKIKYVKTERFNKIFSCSECCQHNNLNYLITTLLFWSNYVKITHNRDNALTLQTNSWLAWTMLCLFCRLISFNKHQNNHVHDDIVSNIFSNSFSCLTCHKDS